MRNHHRPVKHTRFVRGVASGVFSHLPRWLLRVTDYMRSVISLSQMNKILSFPQTSPLS